MEEISHPMQALLLIKEFISKLGIDTLLEKRLKQ